MVESMRRSKSLTDLLSKLIKAKGIEDQGARGILVDIFQWKHSVYVDGRVNRDMFLA